MRKKSILKDEDVERETSVLDGKKEINRKLILSRRKLKKKAISCLFQGVLYLFKRNKLSKMNFSAKKI